MTATQTTEQEDLGAIKLRKKPAVRVCLLPSKTESIVVKYRPTLAVACVVPPVKLQAKFCIRGRYSSHRNKTYKTVDVQSPTLIMYGSYETPPSPGQTTIGRFQLLALDTSRTDQAIYQKPYKLANVHGDGKICFGSVNPPKNLKQAFNFYWASGFNTDLSSDALSGHYRVCDQVSHSYHGHTGCYCDGSQKDHQCTCSRKAFHKHLGCRCTTVAASKKCKGRCQEGKLADQIRHCECCKAYQAHWLQVDLGTRKKRDEVTSCGCSYRHKRGCECGKNLCECNCNCECCNEICNHNKNCRCSCCRATCDCVCRCSKNTKFAYYMQVYNEKILPDQPWRKGTQLICGDKYWGSPSGAEAILITNNSQLLKKIPEKYWRRDKDQQPILIAAANSSEDGGHWVFESKSFKFTLASELVSLS